MLEESFVTRNPLAGNDPILNVHTGVAADRYRKNETMGYQETLRMDRSPEKLFLMNWDEFGLLTCLMEVAIAHG